MINKLRNVAFGFLVPISNFVVDPALEEGNNLFHEQKYEQAYRKYAEFMFHCGRLSPPADYHVALVGKSSCMLHLSSEEMFGIERGIFCDLMGCELTPEQQEEVVDILSNSVYFNFAE